jgi:hypothetical protein
MYLVPPVHCGRQILHVDVIEGSRIFNVGFGFSRLESIHVPKDMVKCSLVFI